MSRRNKGIAICLIVGVLATERFDLGRMGRVAAAAGDQHAYFNALVARKEIYKSYSLRPALGEPVTSPYYGNQLLRPRDGGYAACNSCGLWITYDPANDRDPNAQDAAKIVIPAFVGHPLNHVLGSAVNRTETVLSVPRLVTSYQNPRSIRIDGEIMTAVDPDGRTGALKSVDVAKALLYVQRGQFGTAPADHAASTPIEMSVNTVQNNIRLPFGTTDGSSYLLTWDAFWTDSYLRTGLTNHKAFNLISDGIWLQPNAKFKSTWSGFNPATDVAEFNARMYGAVNGPADWLLTDGRVNGPGTTRADPIAPQAGRFVIKPNTWTRFWVRIDQRANAYDYMDMWAADERNDAVQIYSNIPLSVRPKSLVPHSIEEFVVEFNTSTDVHSRGDFRDLVAYVRNVVVLRNVSNPASVLERPIGGPIGPRGPLPPPSVRVRP